MDLSPEIDELLADFPQWAAIRAELVENDKDPQLWTDLVAQFESLVSSQLNTLKTNSSLCDLLDADMQYLLTRFPYLADFWKRYVALEYSIAGLDRSIGVLEQAVSSFPCSLELWVDYLNVLISNNLKEEPQIRDLFKQAVSHVGRQFMAHPIWDLYLDWESKHAGPMSLDYVQILLQVVKYPLHQYARYFESLYETITNFTLADLVPTKELDSLVATHFQDTNLEDLDADQLKQISDEYFNGIFTQCYTGVTERWEYESQLPKQNFDFLPVSEQDMTKWTNYLDFEESRGDLEQVKSLYERALVPTCSYETFWIRYLRYLIRNTSDTDFIVSVFNKATDVFVSIDQPEIRYMYAKYYELKLSDLEKARQIYIGMLVSHPDKPFPLARYYQFLYDVLGYDKVNEQSQKLLEKLTGETDTELDSEFADLFKVLTIWTAPQVVVELAKLRWLKRSDVQGARSLLNIYFKSKLTRASVSYWTFFFKFELVQKNAKGLASIVNYVKTHGQIPTSHINLMIDEYRDFLLKTSTPDQLQPVRELIRYILETDPESSTHMKHFLKARLDINHDEDATNKRLVKENGHPGAVTEYRPRLVDPIDFEESLVAQTQAAAMPRFANVERANMAPKYLQMDAVETETN